MYSAKRSSVQRHHAKGSSAKCILPNVVLFNVVLPNVVLFNVVLPNVVLFNVVRPNVILFKVILPSIVKWSFRKMLLCQILFNVILLNAARLKVKTLSDFE
jgi:hypothetical protein